MIIQGFDYTTQQAVGHSRKEWSALLAKAARSRIEKGETFAHDSRGVLLFEVYASIQVPSTADPDWLS